MNSVTVDNFSFNGAPVLLGAFSIDSHESSSTPAGYQSSTSSTSSPASANSSLSALSPESLAVDHHITGRGQAAPESLPDPAAAVAAVTIVLHSTYNYTWSRAEVMKSLKESPAHKIRLRQLHESERQLQKEGAGKKKNVRRQSKSVYMVLGCYAVVQSAIFAAAAQTSIFTCGDWWGPVGIALIVTLGTFISVSDKLMRMGKHQQEVLRFQTRQNAVWDQIHQLYLRGATCNLDTMEPHHEAIFYRDPGLRYCVFSPRSLLALGFLICFSSLIVLSCTTVLCSNCKCTGNHKPALPPT